MRFHVLGICHTISSKEYLSCAFTQKVVKFCSMMMKNSTENNEKKKKMTKEQLVKDKNIHYVIHYGHERSDVECDEHVTVTNDDILKKTYGDYNWKKEFFKHAAGDFAHTAFTYSAIAEVFKRRTQGDFILCFWGWGHQKIADQFNSECLVVEPGIGYPPETSFAQFKVYESYAVMHNHYGLRKITNPPWYDCVIPNYFEPDDFDFKREKGNYFLYLGRIIRGKGIDVVVHLAKKMGFRLIIAGQGSLEDELGEKNPPSNIQYVGYADLEKRKNLMANAKALFLPTAYIEPFGGVVVEAMMSGTPVITCDWGVFNETVLHGITGYRCRTIDQFEWAVRNIDKISPQACRDWAVNNYSTDRVRKMYEEYFDMLLKLKFQEGFTLEDPSRTELDWLYREYPRVDSNNSLRAIENIPIPETKSRYKVLIFTETKWAFGRIAQAIQKYSEQVDIDIISWESGIPDEKKFSSYDLIYATVWDIAYKLEKIYPNLKNKITFSGHGKVDFLKMTLNDSNNRLVTEEQMNNFEIDKDLVNWLKDREVGFSVVSNELYNKFISSPYNFEPNKDIYLTQCGADDQIFTLDKSQPHDNDSPLRVVSNLPKKWVISGRGYGYDAKRKWLIDDIHSQIEKEKLNIELLFPEDFLPLDQMAAFYQKGDIWLCVSHSEGNPLGAFEAGACGLTVITTKVGEMPEFIKDGINGFLIDNEDPEKIATDITQKLKSLCDDRNLLRTLKSNMYSNFSNEWTWKHKIKQWENFFLNCVKNKKF